MSKLASALPDAKYEGFATVHDAGLRGMITLKGDLSSTKLKSICTKITAVDFPDVRGANFGDEKGLCWMAPDELLLLCPYADVAQTIELIDKALAGTHYLAANVSDARALFCVEGPQARDVLAKLSPADMHPQSFKPGEMRRTRLAQVPAAFWMRDDQTFEIVCFRSVAEYVFGLLSTAAKPGTELPQH